MQEKNKITSLNLKNKKKTKDDLNAENYLKIVKEKIGFIPNVLAAFSNFPKQFEGFTKLYNSIMLGDVADNIYFSSRNVKDTVVFSASNASTYDLLDCQKLIFDLDGIEKLNNQLSEK